MNDGYQVHVRLRPAHSAINYKLQAQGKIARPAGDVTWLNPLWQSVAHMPLRSLTYKALNTVVDDFFSQVHLICLSSLRLICIQLW